MNVPDSIYLPQNFIFLNIWMLLYYINIPHILLTIHQIIGIWTVLDCKQKSTETEWASISVIGYSSFGCMFKSNTYVSCGRSLLRIFEETPDWFPSRLYQFVLASAMNEHFPTSSPAWAVVCVICFVDLGHEWSKIKSQNCFAFNLHFLGD